MNIHCTLSLTALFDFVAKMNYWLKRKQTLAWPVVDLETKYDIISSTFRLDTEIEFEDLLFL